MILFSPVRKKSRCMETYSINQREYENIRPSFLKILQAERPPFVGITNALEQPRAIPLSNAICLFEMLPDAEEAQSEKVCPLLTVRLLRRNQPTGPVSIHSLGERIPALVDYKPQGEAHI